MPEQNNKAKKVEEKEEFPTMGEIQERILSLKQDPKKIEAKECKKMRERAKKQRSKEELEHLELKQKLLEKENRNFSKIYFLQTADNWGWQAFDNSALFFDDYISGKIGVAPRLKVDNDFDCRANKGTVFVREMEKLITKLKPFGIESSKEGQKIIILELGKEYTEEDIKGLLEKDESRWLDANRITPTAKRLYPNLTAKMRETAQVCYGLIRKMNPVGRDVCGVNLLKILYEMDLALNIAQKSGKNVLKTLEKLLDDKILAESILAVVADFRDLSPEEISKMGFQLQELRIEIKRAIKKERKGASKDKEEEQA